MAVLSDLKRRTGVGAGGATLYVVALAAGLAVASLRGDGDYGSGEPLVFLAGLLYAVGLLGVVAAASNAPRSLLLAVGRRLGVGEGPTAVAGTAEPVAGTLESPFGGETCFCFTYRVLEVDVAGLDGGADPDDEADWRLVATGDDGVPFAVRTPAGERVRVDPAAATCHFADRDELLVEADERPPGRVRAFCREAGVGSAPGDAARRYQEASLAPGEEAFVFGRVRGEAGPTVSGGRPFVVADADYPARVRDRVVVGLGVGLPVTVLGLLVLLFAAGAL